MLLLPGDRSCNESPCYLYVVNDDETTNYRWTECKLKLPKPFYFGAGSKVIVALECILMIFERGTDYIWFCDLKNLNEQDEYQWITVNCSDALPDDNVNKASYRNSGHVVLTPYHFIHFFKVSNSARCDPYHTKMGLFQLFPQVLIEKYVEPLVYGYVRECANNANFLVPHEVQQLIFSFGL